MERLKAWAGIIGIFFGLPLLLWLFVVKAPFMAIFTWVAFFIGVPMVWKKLNKGDVLDFWKSIAENGIKIGVSLSLFLLVRAYFTLLIGFALFESWVNWSTSTGADTILGYTPTKILFELVFIIVVGYLLIIKAVYEKIKTSRAVLVSFLIFCFLLQTFSLGTGAKTTRVAKAAFKEEAMANAVEKYGVLGGVAVQLKAATFGKTPAQTWEGVVPLDKFDTGLAVKNGGKFYITADKEFYLVQTDGRGDETLSLIQGPINNRPMTYSLGGGIWIKAKHLDTKVKITLD